MNKFLILGVILCLFLVGCSQQTKQLEQKQATGNSVVIENFAFNPTELTINVGDTVTWKNQDSAPHTIKTVNNEFESNNLNKGDEFGFKFDKAGEYNYICSIHPSMKGKITAR